MKRYFLTGLILLLPFAISIFLLIWLIDLLTDPFLQLAHDLLKNIEFSQTAKNVALFFSRVFILIFFFFFTLLLGFLARKYLFSRWISRIQTLFLKIPVLRVVYRLSHDIAKTTFNAESKFFKETVLVPFPHGQSLAIGLITNQVPAFLRKAAPIEIESAVFVPTSPHPISGFLLLAPRSILKPLNITPEEAFKYIISCGTVAEEIQKNQK